MAMLLVSSLCAPPALARKPTPKEQALSHLKEGNLRFANGNLEGALENYRLAGKLYASPKIDYSIGNVLFEMKKYAQAERAFRSFLDAPGKSSRVLIQTARIKLKKIEELIAGMSRGGLLIKSIPPGATATLSGKPLDGVTPITVKDLAPRIYDLVVQKDGIYRYETTVRIEPDKYSTVTAALSKIKGILDISSDPPEASISLDGRLVGLTPKVIKDVDAGTHKLVLSKEGYARWKQDITLAKGNDKQSIEATLQKMGVLVLLSEPPGAKAYYNKQYIGKTPVKVPAPPMEYVIRFTMDKMETVERTVLVEPGEEAQLKVAMELSAEEIRRRAAIEEAKRRRTEELAHLQAAALARQKALEEAKKRTVAAAARKRREELARRKAEELRKHKLLLARQKVEQEALERKRRQQAEVERVKAARTTPDAVNFNRRMDHERQDGSAVPIYKKWWFWTIIGVAVVGGTVGGVVAGTTGGDDWVATGADGRFDRTSFRD